MRQLTTRRQRILHAVVDGYVETAEPIGSEWLASRHDFGCRSATLRNEMNEMSEEGFLVQPHTSAGRIPTTMGYRYYVDHLMTPTWIRARPRLGSPRHGADVLEDVNEIVRDACRLLVQLTEYPSVASAPTSGDVLLHRVFLARADARHALLVMLFSTGHTESRIVELEGPSSDRKLADVADSMNRVVGNRPVREIRDMQIADAGSSGATGGDASRVLLGAVRQVAASFTDDELLLEGASMMLRQREFQDVMRIEQVLTLLMDGNALGRVLRQVRQEHGVAVLIGPESRVECMGDCSLVTHRYQAGSRGWGYIGVVGPTRMRYDRVVAAVELTAGALSTVLSRASFTES